MPCRRIDLRSLNFKISHNIEVANCADIGKPKNRLIILFIGFPPLFFVMSSLFCLITISNEVSAQNFICFSSNYIAVELRRKKWENHMYYLEKLWLFPAVSTPSEVQQVYCVNNCRWKLVKYNKSVFLALVYAPSYCSNFQITNKLTSFHMKVLHM